jgi:hypothetical protein
MKAIQISDELYDKLKDCVVDPFDDTPESVISRLIDIVDKAKKTRSPWDAHTKDSEQPVKSRNNRCKQGRSWKEQAEPVL